MKIYILKLGIGLLALLLSSCNNWLDVKPDDKILEDDLLNDQTGFETALNGIYLGMAAQSVYGCELSCGYVEALAQMYSINQQMTGTSSPYLLFTQYKYTDSGVKSYFQKTWEKMYELIANCNNLIEKAALKSSVFKNVSEYNGYVGELYALRAFLHFDVFRLWGPVYNESTKLQKCIPYYKKRTSLPVALSTAENVVADVLGDLHVADSLLPQTPGSLKMKIDHFGVRALQARVYLYAGDKSKAYEMATELVGPEGQALYPFVTRSAAQNATSIDRLYYTEQIFLLENSQRYVLYENLFDHLLDDWAFLAPSLETIETLFSNTVDYRYSQWKLNPGNGKGVSFVKFAKITDDEKPMRTRGQSLIKISELYLILAECATEEAERVKYMEQLRMGRGFQAGSVSDADKSNWETTLQTEYCKEFYGEGQYFFFLKRKNISSLKAGNGKESIAMGSAQYELPLPDSESQYR